MNTESLAATIYPILRNAHLSFGAVGLVAFWFQIARRKGGRGHRRLGWIYLSAMIGVLITAVPMTGFIWRAGQTEVALFLGFLTVITFVAGLEALLASRNRTTDEWCRGPLMLTCTALIFGYSLLLLVLFFKTRMVLLLIMGAFGLLGTLEAVLRLRRERAYHWVEHHLDGMIATGIAVHIAFLSFGLRRFFDGQFTLWAFVVPLVVGHFLSVYFRRGLRRRPNAGQQGLSTGNPKDRVRSL